MYSGNMKNTVMHPASKKFTLGFYLILYRRSNQILIKHAKLLRATMGTIKAQTSCWPELQRFLLSRRKRILKGHRFEKIEVPDLARKSPDEILAAIIKS